MAMAASGEVEIGLGDGSVHRFGPGHVNLAEDLKSYDSVAERTVMDASGKELQVIPGIAGHAVRMDVEFPKSAPAQ